MTIDEKVQYWVSLSDYDIDAAVAMLRSKHYLYVAFMCHQAIEKIFKAAYTKLKEETPPYTHKLASLALQSGFYERLSEEQKSFVMDVEPLNIEGRYPDYKRTIAQSLSLPVCEQLWAQTKILQQWIKETILLRK